MTVAASQLVVKIFANKICIAYLLSSLFGLVILVAY